MGVDALAWALIDFDLYNQKTHNIMKAHARITLPFPFVVLACLMLCHNTGQAQRQPMHKWEIKMGAGMRPTFSPDKPTVIMPPLMAEVRARLTPAFSLGLLLGHSQSYVSRPKLGAPNYRNNYQNQFSVAALRVSAHSSPRPKWEAFGGMILGYGINKMNLLSTTDNTIDPRASITARGPKAGNKAFLSAYIGGNYRLGKHLGLFAELGFGISILTGGISYRL